MITSTPRVREDTPEFPCLRHFIKPDGPTAGLLVVLFTADSVGTVVHSETKDWIVGQHGNWWLMGAFHEYAGQIVLQNGGL